MSLDAELRRALDAKAKPVGSLGRLEDLAVQLGLLQGSLRPAVTDPVVLVFAGDHGAVSSGVSAYPSAVTAAMVGAYLGGRAAINLFARQAGARLLVVDAGVATALAPADGLVDAKVAPGTQDWTRGPAMTAAQAASAVAGGAALIDGLADGGTTVRGAGRDGDRQHRQRRAAGAQGGGPAAAGRPRRRAGRGGPGAQAGGGGGGQRPHGGPACRR